MPFGTERLERIFDRTSGKCHLCHRRLAFSNYGCPGRRGAWEVEHSRPRARGGTDHGNNLYPACCFCNRDKGVYSTRAARAWNRRCKAPMSRSRREAAREGGAISGGVVGAFLGATAGPFAMLIGAAIDAKVGYDQDPDD
jgi:HNH endonuclease